jgi:DNA-binding HxlR family transcriptional regulator
MAKPEASDLDKFYRVLSKEGTVEILSRASEELTSGKDAIREIGLSQKLYYSRLSELRRLGLIEKEGVKRYRITENGRLILDLRDRLTRAMVQSRASLPVESRVITSYPVLVETLAGQIDSAKNRVKLASRYIDPTIAKSTFEAIDRNVSVQAIYKEGKAHLARLALDSISLLRQDFSLPLERIWKQTRMADIPFSFAVVDGHWSGIELVGPDETFLAALEFEGKAAARTLGVLFRHYFRIGSVFPRFW